MRRLLLSLFGAEMMSRRLEKTERYPFAWLDEIVEMKLNPEKGNPDQLNAEELYRLRDRFGEETRQVLGYLKTQTFWIFSPKKRKALLLQFHQALYLLKEQANFNQLRYTENSLLKITGAAILVYLEDLSNDIAKRYPNYVITPETIREETPPSVYKIVCELSIDQIGIILKAADDARLIVSRSLSLVFKTIVPYLSTRNKKELSWDSMRSNSYHPEERDKQAAIAALEKLIGKIRDYN